MPSIYSWAWQFARHKGYHRPSPEGLRELWSPKDACPGAAARLRKRSTFYQGHERKRKLNKSDCSTFSEPIIAAR